MSTQFENVARNPVGRLHRILVSLPAERRSGQTVGQALIAYFGVADSTTATQMELYADLAHLVVAADKTVDDLRNYEPEDLQAFRNDINRVAQIISSHNPQTPVTSFKAQFSAELLKGLEFYSRILNRESPESTLDSATLQKVLTDVETLIGEILDSDLDSQLKAILLEHLSAVERALRLYAISGSVGLRRAADGLAGATFFGYVEHTETGAREWLNRCANLAGWIAALTGFVANARTALPEFLEHLPQLMGGN